MSSLSGKICIVTGATRGIGKGIALQLGEAGATVYITGRTLEPKADSVGGSLQETAQEVVDRGGKCIPVRCDHGNDDDVKQLFERVKKEQNGRLDVLVNNAYSAVTAISNSMSKNLKYWEEGLEMWDTVNKVGLRGHYIASIYAAEMMVPAKQGFIVNVSSAGGLVHFATVPYCIGKSGCDRMAAECAIHLRKHNIAFISLWPGPVQTEHVKNMILNPDSDNSGLVTKDTTGTMGNKPDQVSRIFENGEHPEFAGKAIVHLATDPNVMKKSGRIIHTTAVANEFGFNDVDGRHHLHMFSLKNLLVTSGHTWMAAITPEFFRFPGWMVAGAFHHF